MASNIEIAQETRAIVRRGRRLEYFTIAYNCLEGIVSLIAGVFAGSISLIGFGLDSFIEVTSGAALIWRLGHETDAGRRAMAERTSLRIVGACFSALAAYVAYDAARALILGETPERSVPGILIAIASLIVMPLLARAKRKVSRALNSSAMHADSRQTDFCTYLSAIVLAGLLLNAVFGWWWADPVAALAMVPIISKEALDALRGRPCCGCSGDTCHGGS
ncbi:MAG TPA: cation transporter [Bryobacteraceae bacterium]|nr:cation transporter [Bryobacteraceae bacterium]